MVNFTLNGETCFPRQQLKSSCAETRFVETSSRRQPEDPTNPRSPPVGFPPIQALFSTGRHFFFTTSLFKQLHPNSFLSHFFFFPRSSWSDEHNYTSTARVDMCRLLPLPACWFGCSNSPLCPLLPLLASFHTSLVKLEHNWRASAYVPVRRLCRGTSSISSESLNQCGSRSRGRLCKEAPLSSTASG